MLTIASEHSNTTTSANIEVKKAVETHALVRLFPPIERAENKPVFTKLAIHGCHFPSCYTSGCDVTFSK